MHSYLSFLLSLTPYLLSLSSTSTLQPLIGISSAPSIGGWAGAAVKELPRLLLSMNLRLNESRLALEDKVLSLLWRKLRTML